MTTASKGKPPSLSAAWISPPVVADVAPEHVVAELRVLALDAVGGTGRLEKSGKVGWGLRHQGLLASSEGDIVA